MTAMSAASSAASGECSVQATSSSARNDYRMRALSPFGRACHGLAKACCLLFRVCHGGNPSIHIDRCPALGDSQGGRTRPLPYVVDETTPQRPAATQRGAISLSVLFAA